MPWHTEIEEPQVTEVVFFYSLTYRVQICFMLHGTGSPWIVTLCFLFTLLCGHTCLLIHQQVTPASFMLPVRGERCLTFSVNVKRLKSGTEPAMEIVKEA